jgi:carbon monoxide dehydrogenase subunit G
VGVKGELEVLVDRPVDAVFERLASPEALLEGVSDLEDFRRVSGRGGVGTRYEATVTAAGRTGTVTAEVVEREEPSRIAYEIEAEPGKATLDLELEPDGKRTRLHCSYDVEIRGMARFVAGPIAKAWLKRNEAKVRSRVKAALEAPKRGGRGR